MRKRGKYHFQVKFCGLGCPLPSHISSAFSKLTCQQDGDAVIVASGGSDTETDISKQQHKMLPYMLYGITVQIENLVELQWRYLKKCSHHINGYKVSNLAREVLSHYRACCGPIRCPFNSNSEYVRFVFNPTVKNCQHLWNKCPLN